MKESELDQTLTYQVKDILNRIAQKENSKLEFDDVLLINYLSLPIGQNIIKEIQNNVAQATDKKKYIERLKSHFDQIYHSDLMGKLLEYIHKFTKELERIDLIASYYGSDNQRFIEEMFPYTEDLNPLKFKFSAEFRDKSSAKIYSKNPEYLYEVYNDLLMHTLAAQRNSLILTEIAELIVETIQEADKQLFMDKTKSVMTNIKLNFNTDKGNKKILYYVIQQLYSKKIINNSYEEIAAFLIENVTGFETASLKNLTLELSRKSDPMNHRKIDIPDNLPELD